MAALISFPSPPVTVTGSSCGVLCSVPKVITKPFSLKPEQWFQYFLSTSYYLVGFAYLVLILAPLLYIFFRVPSFFIQPEVYFLSFLPYIVLSTSVFYLSLRKRNYKPRDLILGQLLGASTFYVYIKAALAALLGLKISFGVTSKAKGGAVPYRMLWPQLTVIAATFIALVWAVNRFVYEHEPALIINGFWVFYQFLIFTSIFYFNAGADADLVVHKLRWGVKTDLKILPGSKLETSDQAWEWKECLEILTKSPLNRGDKVLCRVWKKKGSSVLFDGGVVGEAKKAWFGGYRVRLGILTSPAAEREHLMKWVKK